MYEVTINHDRRTIYFRATGVLTMDELRKMRDEAKRVTNSFRGEPHVVLADMRGMALLSPEGTVLVGEVIRYGRQRGCVCCVHLSDSSIARLQTARLAREASPYDDITVNAVSLAEAETIIEEKLGKLRPPKAG